MSAADALIETVARVCGCAEARRMMAARPGPVRPRIPPSPSTRRNRTAAPHPRPAVTAPGRERVPDPIGHLIAIREIVRRALDARLTHAELAVLLVIVDRTLTYQRREENCAAMYLATRTGFSERSIYKALRHLTEMGWIESHGLGRNPALRRVRLEAFGLVLPRPESEAKK